MLTKFISGGIKSYIEHKEEEEGKMGKYVTVLGGIISIIIGIWGIRAWWWAFADLLRGAIPPMLVLCGLAAFFAGISEIKDSIQAKKEEKK